MKYLLFSAATMMLGSSVGHAQETRQLNAHEHGAVEINLAVDGSTLFIELESPAMNIVGFEYPPDSDEDKASVAQAEQMLASAADMFSLTGKAHCEIHEASAKWVGDDEHGDENLDEEHAEHDEEHAGEEHAEHEEEHDEHESEEHAEEEHGHDEHEEGEHGEAVHSEFHAEYEFHCGDINSLEKMDVHLFEKFSGIEEIRVQAILPSGQTALELTAQSPVIELQ